MSQMAQQQAILKPSLWQLLFVILSAFIYLLTGLIHVKIEKSWCSSASIFLCGINLVKENIISGLATLLVEFELTKLDCLAW